MRYENDQELKQMCNKEIQVPDSVQKKINRAFKEIRQLDESKKINKMKWISRSIAAAALIGIISITSGFSEPVLANLKAFFGIGGFDKGLETAIEQGYIQTFDNLIAEDQGVKISFQKLFIDSSRIDIGVSLDIDNRYNLGHYDEMRMDYKLIDDHGRVIQHSVPDTKPLVKNLNIIDSIQPFVVKNELDKGKYSLDLLLGDNGGKIEIPDKLTLEIETIKFFDHHSEKKIEIDKMEINGKWNFTVKVDSKFMTFKHKEFIANNLPKEIEFYSAKLTPTAMNIQFGIKANINEGIITKIELQDEKGNRYKQKDGASMETKGELNILGVNFESSYFQNSDKIFLIIKDVNGQDFKIQLNETNR